MGREGKEGRTQKFDSLWLRGNKCWVDIYNTHIDDMWRKELYLATLFGGAAASIWHPPSSNVWERFKKFLESSKVHTKTLKRKKVLGRERKGLVVGSVLFFSP